MAEDISDATPVLDSLLSVFQSGIDSALSVAKAAIQRSFTSSSAQIPYALDAVDTYLADHPIEYYLDSPEYREFVSKLLEGVQSEVSKRIGESSVAFNTAVSNAQTDYNSSLTGVYNAFNTSLAKYNFTVPQTVLLDCEYIERVMSVIFDAKKWRPIAGPQSSWFC